jgi:hypothetical protein
MRIARIAVLGCLIVVGCVDRSPLDNSSGGQVGSATEAVLTIATLNTNALLFNTLSINTLSNNALSGNDLLLGELSNPGARELFKYIVSCALPADDVITLTVNGTTYSFPGSLGFAPQWGGPNGRCDNACTQWVSACLISRLDYAGVANQISLRGDPNLTSTPSELSAYTVREATYYGDTFAVPKQLYACLSPGQTEIQRVCGPSIQGCAVDVLGTCDVLCGQPLADGAFPNCRVPDGNDGKHRGNGAGAHRSLTVYLP